MRGSTCLLNAWRREDLMPDRPASTGPVPPLVTPTVRLDFYPGVQEPAAQRRLAASKEKLRQRRIAREAAEAGEVVAVVKPAGRRGNHKVVHLVKDASGRIIVRRGN